MLKEFQLSTNSQNNFIDITDQVEKIINASSVKNGACIVFIPHTTAAVTINENADPSVRSDMLRSLKEIVPEESHYAHAEGNSPAHIKASMMGSSETILIKNGALLLGTWQGIYFCEFDGPRKRRVIVKTVND